MCIHDGSIYFKIQKLREYFYDKLPENYTYNGDNEIIKLCKELVKNDLARVTVSFGSKRYVRAKISERASFNDKLGAFGMKILIINPVIRLFLLSSLLKNYTTNFNETLHVL